MEKRLYINNIGGKRADTSISELSNMSRSFIIDLIDKNLVLVNGQSVKKSAKLNINDEIIIYIPEEELPDLTPKNIPFNILLDRDNFAVIDKPAGLTVHPAPGNYSDTLVNALLYTFVIDDKDNDFRPGIVHRLDKDTSGVMVIAKNAEYRAKLSELFSNRKVSKKYYALCMGNPKFQEKLVEAPIGRDKRNRQKMAVVENGKKAVSFFRVIERYKKGFLAEVELFTGRTHQIRVHAASIGHSLIGDSLYGGKELFNFTRQALHSHFLEFYAPVTEELISISSKMPKDMVELQENLKRES